MRTLLFLLLVLVASEAIASPGDSLLTRGDYKVEIDLSAGPVVSFFRKPKTLAGSTAPAAGMEGLVRVKWHPDHLLSVGLVSGYQLLKSDRITVTEGGATSEIHATLTALPVMIDVAMQKGDLEVGSSIGGYVIWSFIDDGEESIGSRFELGMIAHAAYRWKIAEGVTLGPELLVNYMSYRGILSLVPQVNLKYDLYTY